MLDLDDLLGGAGEVLFWWLDGRTALFVLALLLFIAIFFVPGVLLKIGCAVGGLIMLALWIWSLQSLGS